MPPATYNACLRNWRIREGIEQPPAADPEAERIAGQHNLLTVLRTRFGSRPAGSPSAHG